MSNRTATAIHLDVTPRQALVDEPVTGSYHQVDPMGLFWSMRPVSKKFPALFLTEPRKPVEIELIAEIDGAAVGGVRLQRRFAADGVIGESVQEQGRIGAFYHPAGSGPYPVVIVLSGSDGTIRENQAALLASHGYAALALRYKHNRARRSECRKYMDTKVQRVVLAVMVNMQESISLAAMKSLFGDKSLTLSMKR
jgi:hypothetical protein